MSWRYHLYDIQPEQVVTLTPMNDNFLANVDELGGYLDEHNIAAGALSRAALADNAAFILQRSVTEDVDTLNPNQGYDDPDDAEWVAIQAQDGWQSFSEDGLRKQFIAKGGTCWVCASFQIHCGTGRTWEYVTSGDPPMAVRTYRFRQMGFGYLVALRVNGTVLNETIAGSADPTGEDYRQASFSAAGVDDTEAGRDELGRLPQGGGGLVGARIPVVVDAVIELEPGDNVVEVVVLNIKGSMQTYKSPLTYIGQRELFCLEMVR